MQQRHASNAETGAGATLRRLLAMDGTVAHPFPAHLAAPRSAARDLGDAMHALCAVHGHHPDLLSIAAGQSCDSGEREWLLQAAAGFAAERASLARLVSAAGPLPSTPGQAMAEAALNAQRHALEMLARSERAGVALGAAVALVGDWQAIRVVLVRAGDRFGVDLPEATAFDVAGLLEQTTALERAVGFGAQQLLAQHRGLWSLLEARASARDDK
ncbi:MAG: hypothetical protein JWN21_1961 [Sphingomonas bacterium]|uniref:DUF6975 family protein n=1 Tax=Sphingomonas bacterium TaxID=1895847 RepID=UPI00260FB728|nr:hypothetical protein [Sphingomonas bacterium]MDB5696418.1 hypothetical protein [Sphingomonas bacterium]